MGGRVLVGGAVAVLAIVAACGGDGGGSVTTEEGGSTSAVPTTVDGTGWCDELAALVEPDDLTPDAIAGAPEEIVTSLEVLADGAAVDPASAPAGTLQRLVRAQAVVESWAHEHCDGDHPFCSLWITASGAIAASSLSDAPAEDAAAELGSLLDEMDDVLSEYAPPEMQTNLRTVLDWMRPTSMRSDADERAAEAAEDALDQWAWSAGCDAASPPQGDG